MCWATSTTFETANIGLVPPISTLRFLSAFELLFDTNGVHVNAAFWHLHVSIRPLAAAALKSHIALKPKLHTCQKDTGALYCEVYNYLLKTYQTDEIVTETDADMTLFTLVQINRLPIFLNHWGTKHFDVTEYMMSTYSREGSSRDCRNWSTTLRIHVGDRKRSLQYMIWRVMWHCSLSSDMARATQMHPVITTRRITDPEILYAEAVMSTPIVWVHHHRLDCLTKKHHPLARCRLPYQFGNSNCNMCGNPPQSSTASINDAPFCLFRLSSNQPTTQCPAILRQLRRTLTHTCQDSFPSIVKDPWWRPYNPFLGQSPLKNGSTPTTKILGNASNMCHASTTRPHRINMWRKRMQYHRLLKQKAKNNRTVTFTPFNRPPEAVVADVTKRNSSSTPDTL